MNALNAFLIANIALSAIALLGFYSLKMADAPSEESFDFQHALAGASGVSMSMALLTVMGRMFI
jgi:hypothetical protein